VREVALPEDAKINGLLMEMVSSTEWLVLASEGGNETYFYWLPNSSNAFNYAELGMLEGYGNAENEGGGGITNCEEYPPMAGGIDYGSWTNFELASAGGGTGGVAQYNPSWNSFDNTSPAWGAFFGNAPNNCDFSLTWNQSNATLYWWVGAN